MEAVAAVSLAANVAQFIDFGGKFISEAKTIYRSSQSSRGAIPDLLARTTNLQTSLRSVQSGLKEDAAPSSNDEALAGLVEQCVQTATEIDESLQEICPPDKTRKRDAIRSAWLSTWGKERIHSMEAEMNSLNGHLTVALLASLRVQAEKSLHQQQSIVEQLSGIQISHSRLEDRMNERQSTPKDVASVFLDAFARKTDPSNYRGIHDHWREQLIDKIHDHDGALVDQPEREPLIPEARRQKLIKRFLKRLDFPEMHDREERIPQAYENTFEWLFRASTNDDTSWDNFGEWLASEHKLYWITGKPGSGKSTLMKFICHKSGPQEEPRHLQYLKRWSGESPLITASFYFWNSGSDVQMSQTGLFLTLLYQLLHQAPSIIASASPARWEALTLFGDDSKDWTETELRRFLRNVVAKLSATTKICLFIDGLDEFRDLHQDLIDLVRDLIANDQVKVCVSSRPWVVFEKAYATKPMLRLQDLTRPDILHFVTTNFDGDPDFVQLQSLEPKYARDLIQNVVLKAEGVFLWVTLVVKSLLAGMSHGDRVSDLQRRLDSLPPDLENLFDKILSSLEPFYLEHAAQLFKLVQSADEPIELLALYYADEEDINVVLKLHIRALTDSERKSRDQVMRNRLNSRCKGLLEAQPLGNRDPWLSTVQYLHRTVKDYIEGDKARRTLDSALKTPFIPTLRLCAGSLASLKSYGGFHLPYVDQVLKYAQSFHSNLPREAIAFLDELNRTATYQVLADPDYWARMAQKSLGRFPMRLCWRLPDMCRNGQWVPVWAADSTLAAPAQAKIADGLFGFTFLSLAILLGITTYVTAKVGSGCLVRLPWGDYWPLLVDALDLQEEARRGMIIGLLERGADPKFKTPIEWRSFVVWSKVWHCVLRKMLKDFLIQEKIISPAWKEIAAAMMQHGAQPRWDYVKSVASNLNSGPDLQLHNPGDVVLLDFHNKLLMCREKMSGWNLQKMRLKRFGRRAQIALC